MKERRLSLLTRVVVLAAFYSVGGMLGKRAEFMSGDVALVWPPAGIALGAILLFGNRFWPGVVLGSIAYSLIQEGGMPPIIFMLGTMLGNTVGALVCAYLLERFLKFNQSLERVRDVAGFVCLACVLGTTVNAAFNAVSLCYMGKVPWDDLFSATVKWWVPNAMACLVITPVILTWGSPSFIRWDYKLAIEAVICCIGLVLATMASFNSWTTYGVDNYPLAYLPYPFLVWGALRFGQRGATAGTLLVSALAIYAMLAGRGPFVAQRGQEGLGLLLLGCYIGILALTNMLLSAAAIERQVAEEAARKSEAMFLLISENVGDLIAVTEVTGKRLYNSPGYAKILGEPEKLVGTAAFDQIHPEDREYVKGVFRETTRTEIGQRIEYRFLLKDGSIRYIESVGNFVRGDRGQPGKVVSISRDITDRKRDEESLRLLASAVRFADDSIVITTADLESPGAKIVFVNPAFTKMTGYTAEEAVGKTHHILQGPKTDRAVLDRLRENLSRGENFDGEAVNYRKDGSEFYNEWHIEPIKNDKGETTHFLAVMRDITHRKQIVADLAKARDAALEASRLKAEFVANMSHEIRTPMNGVIGIANLLLHTDLNRQQRDYAETIRFSAESLLTIINDILDFSKIEAGKLTMETLDFDLREAVESTLELLAERAQSKGIELAGLVQREVPTQLRGDFGRLRQILTNLVGNAIKFTSRGEVVLQVASQGEDGTHAVLRFEIKDTGIGIPKDAQSRLFQAFSQADGSTTRKYGGTGLGLAICNQLVGMMHGEIGVESEPGKGSTFWFTVKLEKQSPATAKSVTESKHDLTGMRLLNVDDNAANRQILRQQTLAWNMRNSDAANGAEALEILRSAASAGDPFKMAILDMQMPGMDGLTLARAIKSDPVLASTRLIILTSLGDVLDAERLKTEGIEACLVKPVKQSRLFDCLINAAGGTPVQTARGTKPASPVLSPPQPGTAMLRILVAEDNDINQKVALGQLQELGYTADTVANGLEVFDALRRIPYNLILMDCHMPEMDGYETTRIIRHREQSASQVVTWPSPIYIIAMTASAMQGDREECLAAGMNDYISKPVDQEELKAALKRWKPMAREPAVETTPAPRPADEKPAVATSERVPLSVATASAPERPPVDLKPLTKLTRGDPKKLREYIELFLVRSDDLINKLKAAVQAGSAEEIYHVAHQFGGVSSTCGMTAIVPSLRELEQRARAGQTEGSQQLYEQTSAQLDRVRSFLTDHLK